MQQEMRHQYGEQWHGRIQDGCDGRIDRPFPPRDQHERDRQVRESQQQQRCPGLERPRQSHALDRDHHDAEQQPERSPERHQRDRADLLHGDLDPHEGRAPDRA